MTTRKATPKGKTIKAKSAGIRRQPKKNEDNPNSKFTNKSDDEREEIKAIVSVGLRKCSSVSEIIEKVKEKGFTIAVSTMYQYIKDIREEWKNARVAGYEEHIERQLSRLDLYENEMWKRYEESKDEAIIVTIIDKIWVRRNDLLGITSSTINIQNNIQNNLLNGNEPKPEVKKVEFQPLSDKFFGNFVIEVEEQQAE